MPEGHTIHRFARDHAKLFEGRKVRASSPQGRFAEGAEWIDGRTLKGTDAWGKHLFYDWGRGGLLHVHLGMAGKFRAFKGEAPEPGPAVRLRMTANGTTVDLSGPMRCTLITRADQAAVIAKLGPDPIRRDADPDRAWVSMQKSRRPAGMSLIDQGIFAGVGNIYRSEVLYLVGVHPNRPSHDVSRDEFDAIWAHLVKLMRLGVRTRKIITVGAFDKKAKERFYVYKNRACIGCKGEIEWLRMSGRGVYACQACQD